MAVLDGCDEVGIGFDLGWQLMAHDLDQIVAGQQIGRVAMDQALLGEEHQRDHHQRHVMVPRLPAPDLIVSHATSALGVHESALDEMPGDLHVREPAQADLGLGIGEAELQLGPVGAKLRFRDI